MKTLSISAALSGAVLLLGACAGTTQRNQQMTSMTSDGARIWRMTCSQCHNTRPASEFDAREWTVIVSHMRTRAHLTRTEADAVAAFLSSASSSDAAASQ